MRSRAIIVILSALLATASAGARPPSLIGDWRWNGAESELLPGETAPKALVMHITRDDASGFAWTVTVSLADGESGQTVFSGAIDGRPYPIAGRPGSTSAFTWTADGALKQVSESPAGLGVEICSFAGDMRRMDCDARQTNLDGRVFTYTEIFDRQ